MLASAHPELSTTVLAVADGMVRDPLHPLRVLLFHVSPLPHWAGRALVSNGEEAKENYI